MIKPEKYWFRRYPLIGVEGEGEEEKKVILKKDDQGREYYEVEGKRLFTQEHMNVEIGKARTKAAEANKPLILQLEEMKAKASTSEAMRTELQEQIENLQAASMTKEEQMAQRLQSLENEVKRTKETLGAERDEAMNRWRDERITNALTAAAAVNNAFSPEQITGLLNGKTELKPVVDDKGKQTGKYEVLVSLDTEDGVKQLAPVEALRIMREEQKERYGNLFKAADVNGMGGGNSNGTQTVSATPTEQDLATPESYAAWRAKQPK